jgi:hypothetical protein
MAERLPPLIERGLVKRSAKRPSRRSQATAGESSVPDGVPAGDAEHRVSKSAPPWIGLEQPFQRGRLPLCYSVLTPAPRSPQFSSGTAKLRNSTKFSGAPRPLGLARGAIPALGIVDPDQCSRFTNKLTQQWFRFMHKPAHRACKWN